MENSMTSELEIKVRKILVKMESVLEEKSKKKDYEYLCGGEDISFLEEWDKLISEFTEEEKPEVKKILEKMNKELLEEAF